MTRAGLLLLGLVSALAPTLFAAEPPAGIPADYKLLYEQSFAKPDSLKDLVFRDPTVWKHSEFDGGCLELKYVAKTYKPAEPKNRSPYHIALIADKLFADFVMDVEMQSTVAPYAHQDMCLFFGFESPQKYYYAHLAVAADPKAHNIFIVNDAPRKNIAKETTKGIVWGENQWHKLRLVRDANTGKIEVYFDDLSKPIMRAEDKTFAKGYLGFGSFDDQGRFRNMKVYGRSAENKKCSFFQARGDK